MNLTAVAIILLAVNTILLTQPVQTIIVVVVAIAAIVCVALAHTRGGVA